MIFSPTKLIKRLSFHVLLMSFVASFFVPSAYKAILFTQFYVIAPIVVLLNYNIKLLSHNAQVLFLIFTGITIMIGVPGSAFGYAASATVGLFLSRNSLSKTDGDGKIDYFLFLITGIFFSAASFNLLYLNFKTLFSFDQVAEYFGQSSINYASLTIASFCSIFATWAVKRQTNGAGFTKVQKRNLRILASILALCILGLSIIFSTRSALFGFIPPLIYAVQPKKPIRYLLFFIVGLVAVYFIFPIFSEFVLSLIVPGRENLVDLYNSELKGQERSESAWLIYTKAIPYFSFCVTCSDYMSFSGISNLIALSFPFSIFYVVQIIRFLLRYMIFFILSVKINKLFCLVMMMSFFNSLLLSLFQADFLSMLSLFYTVGTGLSIIADVAEQPEKALVICV